MTSFGSYLFDPANRRLYSGSAETRLTPKAAAILELLTKRPNELVTHDELLDSVWRHVHVQPEVLKVYIAELRRALHDPADKPRYIETVHRRGYRFVRPAAESAVTAPARSLSEPLVGRSREIARLYKYMGEAANGRRKIVFLTGEAGIGKTSLLNDFIRQVELQPGVCATVGQVARARGEAEPFSVVLSAIASLLSGEHRDSVVSALRQYAPGWLLQFPSLLDPSECARLDKEMAGATSQRMSRDLAEALEAISQEVLLVLGLDDIDRVEPSTLDLLDYLASRNKAAKILLIAAVNDGEGSDRVRSLIAPLHARGLCEEIKLDVFSEDSVRRFLDIRYPPADVANALTGPLHRMSGGVPLFLQSLAHYMVTKNWILRTDSGWIPSADTVFLDEIVPPTLRELVELQLRDVALEDQRVLEAASIAGLEFPAAFVSRALGESNIPIEAACTRIVRQGGWLQFSGFASATDEASSPRFKFIHELYREALYYRQTPEERVRRHRRVAIALEQTVGSRAHLSAPELALQFAGGRKCSKSIQYLRMAAANAQRRFASSEAAVLLSEALGFVGHLPQGVRKNVELEILNELAIAYFASGDFANAALSWHKILMKAMKIGRTDLAIDALAWLAFPVGWDKPSQLSIASGRVLGHVETIEDPVARAEVTIRALAANNVAGAGKTEDLATAAEGFEEILKGGDPVKIASARIEYAFLRLRYSNYREVIGDIEQSLPLALEHSLIDVIRAEWSLSWALLHAGEWGRMQSVAEAAVEHARKNGNQRIEAIFLTLLAWLHVECGSNDTAQKLCQRVTRLAGNPGRGVGMAMCHVIAGMAAIGREEIPTALDHVERAASFHLPPEHFWRVMNEINAVRAHLMSRANTEAQRSARRLLHISENMSEKTWKAIALITCAQAAGASGQTLTAFKHRDAALQLVEEADLPLAKWRVEAAAADLYDADKKSDLADQFRERSRNSRELLFASLGDHDSLKTFMQAKTA